MSQAAAILDRLPHADHELHLTNPYDLVSEMLLQDWSGNSIAQALEMLRENCSFVPTCLADMIQEVFC